MLELAHESRPHSERIVLMKQEVVKLLDEESHDYRKYSPLS